MSFQKLCFNYSDKTWENFCFTKFFVVSTANLTNVFDYNILAEKYREYGKQVGSNQIS